MTDLVTHDDSYTTDTLEVIKLAEEGHILEKFCSFSESWKEVSFRHPLYDDHKLRAHKSKMRTERDQQGRTVLREGDTVIFKQRIARHLSVYSDLEFDYEAGSITSINLNGEYVISWLQGFSSRTDDVPYEDIVSVSDSRGEHLHPEHLGFSGRMFIINEIVAPKPIK